MRFSNEIKAGLVVVVAILLAVFFFANTAKFPVETYSVKTSFRFAGDLKTDAIVKLSGVEVGRLKKISFVYDPDTKVECLLEVDSTAKIREDSIAYVGTAGFVGDAYIGITPGTSGTFVKSGASIASEDPIQMRILFKKADAIADNMDKILAEVKTLVVDNRQNLNNIITNVEAVTENFKEFSQDVKDHPWKLLFKGE